MVIKDYFYKPNGDAQDKHIQREKAVSVVLEIINSAAINTGAQNSLGHIQNKLSETADAIQAALEKK